MKKIRLNLLVLFTLILVITLTGCKNDNNKVEDPTNVINIINDGNLWEDHDYVYAQNQGDNPLKHVDYDKANQPYGKLYKELDLDLTDFTKLAISIKGDFYVSLSIISLDESNNELKQIYTIDLYDTVKYYEIDLDDENISLEKGKVVRIELIATPGASEHHGSFEVDQLFFSKAELTANEISTLEQEQVTNEYVSGTHFDFNKNWFDDSHTYALDGNVVSYSRLPKTSTALSSKVSGDFSGFDYINLSLKGQEGVNVLLKIKTSKVADGDVLPSTSLQLTEEDTLYTIFIDDLSDETKNAITSIEIIVEPNSLAASVGEFTITKAEFSNETTAEKSKPTVNYYPGDNQTFDFNNYWQTLNAINATIDEDSDEVLTVVNYTKQFTNSAIYVNLDGNFSDFDYINISIDAEPNQDFFIETTTDYGHRLNHHVKADETGKLNVTMKFAMQFWDEALDKISAITITPSLNDASKTGEFIITKAEFSNTQLVDYIFNETIPFNDIMQMDDDITIDQSLNKLSWTAQESLNPVYVRVFGELIENDQFTYKKIGFTATVSENMTIYLEVDGAYYKFDLTPDETEYYTNLSNSTSGLASTWKFTGGFNLYIHLDNTVNGEIILENIHFYNEDVVPNTNVNVNDEVAGFNGLTTTITTEGETQVIEFTKSAYNSLFYLTTKGDKIDGHLLSEYTYFNIHLESTDISEAMIELSGYGVMKYYTEFENGEIILTMALKPSMIDSQLDGLQYVNIIPMPNSDNARGTIKIKQAYFSNEPLVTYETKTLVAGNELKEVGSNFTITDNVISWDAGAGYKPLMVRMYGSYANDTELTHTHAILTATVTEEVMVQIDINYTKYDITLVPGQTEYIIDLLSPTQNNADLWKFQTGFNMIFNIDTTTAGSIDLTRIEFIEATTGLPEGSLNVNDEVAGFNGLTSTITNEGEIQVIEFTKSAYNSLFYLTTKGDKIDGHLLSEYKYFNIHLESTDISEAMIELSGYGVMKYYTEFENGEIILTIALKPSMIDSQLDGLQYVNIIPMPNSDNATGTIKIKQAYFSNEPLVTYETKTVVTGNELKEVGSNFTITDNVISWDAGAGYKPLMVRMYGSYANDTEITHTQAILTATVTEDVMVQIDINYTRYDITLVPGQTEYIIDLLSPTQNNADLWKFQTGFNMIFNIDTTTAGNIDLTSIEFVENGVQ